MAGNAELICEPMTTEPETQRIRDAYARRRDGPPSAAISHVVAERLGILRRTVAEHLDPDVRRLRILDVGCGAGGDLLFWRDQGVSEAHLAGTELLDGPLAEARSHLPEADLRLVDGFDLPWPDAAFDLVWSSMAFSSIRTAASRRRLFSEMWRVVRPGGLLAIYDFRVRKPGNRDVVAMNGHRVAELGPRPALRIPATPFLPLLPLTLRVPGPLRPALMRILPRTHAVWVWERDG